MPHKCVRCNTTFVDGSADLLKGCTTCGGKFFFFVKKEHLEKADKVTKFLSEEERRQIEHDAWEIIGEPFDDSPVILDLESVNILEEGKFEIDLAKLFRKEPLVYRLEEGKYVIDLAGTFQNLGDKED